jgi:hypothetical protein
MVINYLTFLDEFKGRKFDTTYHVTRKELVRLDTNKINCDTIQEIKLNNAKEIKQLIKLVENKEVEKVNKIDSVIETNNNIIEYKEEIQIHNKDIIKFENKNVNNMGQNLLNISILFASISYVFISYTAWGCFYKELKTIFK